MKKILLSLALMGASFAQGESFAASGMVRDILVRNSMDGFALVYLEDFKSAGTCPTHRGYVIPVIDDNEKAKSFYSMALSAYAASKPIHLKVDDSKVKPNGWCIIQDMRLNKDMG